MKKMLVMLVMLVMMWNGLALADTITINSVSPGIGYVGQINFTITETDGSTWDTWGYCIEHGVNSFIGAPYETDLRNLENTQLWQARLIFTAYDGTTPDNTQANNLQWALWGTPIDGYFSDAEIALYNSMFKWAYVNNADYCGMGQDFIIATNSVAEPTTILLLGFGFFSIGIIKKLKK